MSLNELDRALELELEALKTEGRAKPPERVITGYIPAQGDRGPRYRLQESEGEFIRMNSNSYLSLSHHPEMIRAADEATHRLGVGPGAVRFIDGTFSYHVALEERIARFVDKPAAKIFNSAYTSNCGLALAISSPRTYWIGDQLNHNSIIRAMRIANVPSENKAIYQHNDMDQLKTCLESVPAGVERVAVIFDGIFNSGTAPSRWWTTLTGSAPTVRRAAEPPIIPARSRTSSSGPSAKPSAPTAASSLAARS
jgi:glycine C-acetyltransferase